MKAKNYEEALEISKKYACGAESVLKSYWVIPFEEMETDKHWMERFCFLTTICRFLKKAM